MRTVLTKAQFAERMNRSRSCVSGWIATGKISAAALIGEGREARIWLEQAQADLAASLDPSQQLAQAAPIIISTPESSAPPANELERSAAAAPTNSAHLSERERDLARRAKADADKAEHDAEAARRRLAVDEGRYVLAEDAAAAWGKQFSKALAAIDGFVTTGLPRAIADETGADWRAISTISKTHWRAFREQIAADAKDRREAIENGGAGND